MGGRARWARVVGGIFPNIPSLGPPVKGGVAPTRRHATRLPRVDGAAYGAVIAVAANTGNSVTRRQVHP